MSKNVRQFIKEFIAKRPFLSCVIAGVIVSSMSFYLSSIKQETSKETYSYKRLLFVRPLKYQHILMRDENGNEEGYGGGGGLRKVIYEKNQSFYCFRIGTTGYRYFKSQDFSYRSNLLSIEDDKKCPPNTTKKVFSYEHGWDT